MGELVEWFDRPNPNPKRRKNFEDLLLEIAEKNGDPLMGTPHFSNVESRERRIGKGMRWDW